MSTLQPYIVKSSGTVPPGAYSSIYIQAPSGSNIIIDRCKLIGPGDLITQATPCNLTVTNCEASTNAPNKFIVAWRGISLNIQHNALNGTGGVLVCDDAKSLKSVIFDFNRGTNITGATGPNSRAKTSFFQMQGCRNILGHANWNHFEGTKGIVAAEDIISLMNSSGSSPDTPFEIANNFIRGVYGYPVLSPKNPNFSGSGIMCCDPGGLYNTEILANVYVHDNQVLNCQNQSIVQAAGGNVLVENNRVYNNPAANNHVTYGLQSFNWTDGGGPHSNPSQFGVNSVWRNNLVNVGTPAQNMFFQRPTQVGNNVTFNTSESAEVAFWISKCTAAKVCVGPLP